MKEKKSEEGGGKGIRVRRELISVGKCIYRNKERNKKNWIIKAINGKKMVWIKEQYGEMRTIWRNEKRRYDLLNIKYNVWMGMEIRRCGLWIVAMGCEKEQHEMV